MHPSFTVSTKSWESRCAAAFSDNWLWENTLEVSMRKTRTLYNSETQDHSAETREEKVPLLPGWWWSSIPAKLSAWCCQFFWLLGSSVIFRDLLSTWRNWNLYNSLHLKTDHVSSPNEQWALDAKSRSQPQKVAIAWIWIALEGQKSFIFPSLWGLDGNLTWWI